MSFLAEFPFGGFPLDILAVGVIAILIVSLVGASTVKGGAA